MKWKLNWAIQDGKLDSSIGRIIAYKDYLFISKGPSMDHNDCCFAFANIYGFKSDEIRSKAARFYYCKIAKNKMVISPVRKIDKICINENKAHFDKLIHKYF